MTVKLQRLSICPCGFSVLADEIPLGTEYEVDPAKLASFTWTCGGCGHEQPVIGVWVEARGASEAGWLPKQIFTPPEHPIHVVVVTNVEE